MPRRRQQPLKQTIQVVLDCVPVAVTLYPPAGKKKCWYAYWNGLKYSRSTGQTGYAEAVAAAGHRVRAWKAGGTGSQPRPADDTMTDKEIKDIQRAF